MSVLIATAHTSTGASIHGVGSARRHGSRAHFTTHRGRTGHLIRVVGEIDAANADHLIDQVRHSAWCEWLVLDLAAVEFMGTAGCAALHTIGAYCLDRDVRWTLVASPSVSRLLTICGQGNEIPVSESLTAALASVHTPTTSVTHRLKPAGAHGE
ncbi:STAS domain-containing protein [Mycobacterium sp. DBP42]|uniref:STAS domain-containing protein n=1 Tax=Mycobacterium sp. DBP42 TaxID=2545267 RepID=UPI0014864EE3|nr:STAS domain-containing protein [Mycobacterium sp. DBP42]